MHHGRRNQNERRNYERRMNRECSGIHTDRRGWKIQMRKQLDEKKKQQDAQQKYKTAANPPHHVTERIRGFGQCQWGR